jgi:hypothetical protein
MNVEKTINPHVKWAQRKDKLFLTVEVANLVDPKIDLEVEGKITFR